MKTLAQHAADYLEGRRAAGYGARDVARLLRSLMAYCRRARTPVITAEAAIAWASIGASRRARIRRLRAARELAVFARLEDRRHELPPLEYFGRDRPVRPTPYIVTDEETAALIRSVRVEGVSGDADPRVFETLLGLLICTGIRIGEALALRCSDITAAGLLIRQSKRGRGRLLPLHRTALRALDDYLQWRRRSPAVSDHLFIGARGVRVSYDWACDSFRRLRRAVGQDGLRAGRRLGLHALRHSFAVRALRRGPSRRDEVGVHMKAVSEYLGHAMLQDTYWYYEGTPELLLDVLRECERREAPLCD